MDLFDREMLDGGKKSLNRLVFISRCSAGSPTIRTTLTVADTSTIAN